MSYHPKLLSLALLLFITSALAAAQCTKRPTLDDTERAALVAAAESNRSEISVELLDHEGCFQQMLDELHALGAKDRFTDAKVGYAWVMLPREKVPQIADLAGASEAWAGAADAGYQVWNAPPKGPAETAPVPSFTIPITHVAAELPPDGPYFPAQEAGLQELWKAHPDADGRGVRVALYDDGIDLLHPSLEQTIGAEGQRLPKVADIVPVSSPEEAEGWVRFGDPIHAVDGRFEAAGREWRAPHDGVFRFGMYRDELYFGAWFPGSSLGKPPADVLLSVGVLWDENSNRVWVDTNGDGSFVDQKALGDYGETHDIDWFGSKTGDSDNRLPFGVKLSRDQNAVYISLGKGNHASAVAGTLAANRLTGGLYDGSAPNAQLVDVRGVTMNGMIVPVLAALGRKDVDLLNRSGIFIRYGPGSTLEEEFDRHVLDRATAAYDKPISCLCFSTGALSVDDYQSAEMLRRNRQTQPPYLEATNSDARPDLDGLINTIVAPSAMLATESRFNPIYVSSKEGKMVSTFGEGSGPGSPAPAGYWIGANPSPTIPYGAGVMADLISEARREHVRYNAHRIVAAVLLSGRIVSRIPLAQQGHGVINAAGAWEQLVKMAKADDPANPELTSFMVEEEHGGVRQPVQGFWADFPGKGESRSVRLWITRHGGYAGERVYRLALLKDDDTFQLATTRLRLPQGVAVPVSFSFKPGAGDHLAFMQLIDDAANALMAEIPLKERSSAGVPVSPGVEVYKTTLPPLRSESAHFHFDPTVQAARFVMRVPNAGLARFSNRGMPEFLYNSVGAPKPGGRLQETKLPTGTAVEASHHVGPMEQFDTLFEASSINPFAGSKPHVYDVYWSNGGGIEYATPYDPPVPDVPISGTVVISKYAVALNHSGNGVQVTNQLADITGRVEFYDAKLDSAQLAGEGSHSEAVLNRTLPAHLAEWRIHLSAAALGSGRADAYVFNCADKSGCQLMDHHPLGKAGATFAIDDPQEGAWRIVARTEDETQSIAYQEKEAQLSERTDSEKSDASHGHGAHWSVAFGQGASPSYAAFRVAGTPGIDREKDGIRIATTPLVESAP